MGAPASCIPGMLSTNASAFLEGIEYQNRHPAWLTSVVVGAAVVLIFKMLRSRSRSSSNGVLACTAVLVLYA